MIIVLICSITSFLLFYIILYKMAFNKISLIKKLNDIKLMSSIEKKVDTFEVEKRNKFSFIYVSDNLRHTLLSADIKLKPEEFIVLWFIVALLPSMLYFTLKGFSLSIIGMLIIGIFIPPLFIGQAAKKRKVLFTKQLNDALVIICNCLRSGFTFRYSLQRVAYDLPEPISTEFKRVVREVNLGMKMEDSLASLAERMSSKELMMINSAVIIQQRTGGNLADIISKVSETINDRIKIRNIIRTLSAQGKMSGVIVGGLPIFIALILMIVSPIYLVGFFVDPIGILLMGIAIVSESIGFYMIYKIINIKF